MVIGMTLRDATEETEYIIKNIVTDDYDKSAFLREIS